MKQSTTVPATVPTPAAHSLPETDAAGKAIRDDYIAARFTGAVYCGDDLAETERVIRAARLYFDESQHGQAAELLDLAIALHPVREEPWLARLELAFLARDPDNFCGIAHAFRHFHRASTAWPEIGRLGRALAPTEPMFGGLPEKPASNYGPWPDTPNWIQASWDLTAEVHAAEFHNAMRRCAPLAEAVPVARVA